jgi:hypothetical protein
MNTMRHWISMIALAGLPTAALAQPDTTMTYSIVWEKSVIAPGETNKGKVVCTIEPGLGTVVPWTTPPGKGQPGTIMAFASSNFDITNVQNGLNGKFSYLGEPPALNSSGACSVDPQGNIINVAVGQTGLPLNTQPVLDNPIVIFNLWWTAGGGPGSPYEVAYSPLVKAGKMFLDVGLPSGGWVGHSATTFLSLPGSTFTVIPAPSMVLALGGVGAIMLVPRRRP